MNILVNQVGYRGSDRKIAALRELPQGTAFEIVDLENNTIVFSGHSDGCCSGGSSGDTVSYADFSAVTKPGRYCVRCGSEESYHFAIGVDVYDTLLRDSIRMLYLQRCGTELPGKLAGIFAHPACHTEKATVYGTDETIDVTGGWHDAGDYGRYPVPGAKTIADMLLAFEINSALFGDDLNIPESGNGIPDILDEARWELEWLMKMQRSDGGVYHKVTGKHFDGFVMPEECTEPLFVLPVSITATADCAAVWYMAQRVYAAVDADFAEKCGRCAEKALAYYEAHANDGGWHNPKDVFTGEYGDEYVNDEYLWVLCEGYKTTGSESLHEKIRNFDLDTIHADGLGWEDVATYGYYAYLTSGNQDAAAAQAIGKKFFACADKLCADAQQEAYGSTFPDDYPWGSNMYIANNGIILMMAWQLTGKQAYRLAAQRQLDYLLGVNTLGYCYVTGFGSKSPEKPHHRPSKAKETPMHAMLIGGPNNGLQDPCAVANLTGKPKAACYIDATESYSCNEICIYWNSPLYPLIAMFVKQ